MSGIFDALLVASALAASALYAGLALGPKGWRRRLKSGLAARAARAPEASARRWFWSKLAGAPSGGGACGGCEDCGSGAAAAPDGEVGVPVERIGRRS